MKKIIILLSLIILIGCKSKKVDGTGKLPVDETTEIMTTDTNEIVLEEASMVKLTVSKVAAPLKAKAYELGKRILMTCNTSKFKPFSRNEATQSVIDNMTEENLSKTCAKFRQRYGDFKDLKLMAIYMDNESKTTIFRYKALYQKAVANKELRVYMNEKNQISAIKSMDWTDIFEKKLFRNTDKNQE